MAELDTPYCRRDLALVHYLGFGFHADDCAPGILELLRPVRERDGLVVELGCGSGLLTRYLVDAGHRVIATDAIITERSKPAPDTFVRQMAVYLRNEDGSWRRDDERHENVLIDTLAVPGSSPSTEYGRRSRPRSPVGVQLMDGLHAIVGTKDA